MGFLEDRISSVADGLNNLGSGMSWMNIIFIIVLIAVFLGIAYYIYITHIEPTLKPTYVNNNEFDTPDSLARQEDVAKNVQVGPKRSQLYLFHTEWCPYSKKVMPIWDKIQATFGGQKIKDTDWVIDFIKINGETEAQKLEKFQADYLQDAAKSKIDGYPSIYLVKDDQVIEIEAQPSENTLTEFINTVF